jgi:hypothetical protein
MHGTLEALPATPRFAAAVSLLVMHFLPDDGAKERYLREAEDPWPVTLPKPLPALALG